jgi:transposase
MPRPTILPDPAALRLDGLTAEGDAIILSVHAATPESRCPACERASQRTHSWYVRHVADLPWSDARVRLRLRVRRLFCDNAACVRRIFAERLPAVVAPYGRRSVRLDAWLRAVAFALGGRPGARLVARRGAAVGRDTLLALVRDAPVAAPPTPRVLGVDEFALRRGRTYGTILVDLERRRVVDLLPDRRAVALAAWLARRPGVEVIARDRGGEYADGARRGAPTAVQVADRFHLLVNIGDALGRVLARHHGALRAAAAAMDRTVAATDATPDSAAVSGGTAPEPERIPTRAAQDRAARRSLRLARYEAVVDLHLRGASLRAIGRAVGLSRATARRFVRAGTFPERASPSPRPTSLSPYEPYLRERWTAGCHNARVLHDEIRARGFRGAAVTVRRLVGTWRPTPGRRGPTPRRSGTGSAIPPPPRPPTRALSPRQARWLLLRPAADLRPDDRRHRDYVLQQSAEIRAAQALAEDFAQLVRDRDADALGPWLERAQASDVIELREFALMLRRDRAAIDAALVHDWSNGQTEGQVNRLKSIKRAMYGRACFDLLRQRVLQATA